MPLFHITTRPIGAKHNPHEKHDSVINAATLTAATFSIDPEREVASVRELAPPITVTRKDIEKAFAVESDPEHNPGVPCFDRHSFDIDHSNHTPDDISDINLQNLIIDVSLALSISEITPHMLLIEKNKRTSCCHQCHDSRIP